MSEVLTDYRLGEARSRRERLEEDARGAADENAQIRRHLDAVRAAEASATAAARGTRGRFEDALEDLGTRLAIAWHRLAAELTDNRHRVERAVGAELRDGDTRQGPRGTESSMASTALHDRLEETKAKVALHTEAAGAAEDAKSVASAVSRELDEWYLWLDHLPERLDRREQDAFDAMTDRLMAIRVQLDELRRSSGKASRELATQLDEERKELDESADKLAEAFRRSVQ